MPRPISSDDAVAPRPMPRILIRPSAYPAATTTNSRMNGCLPSQGRRLPPNLYMRRLRPCSRLVLVEDALDLLGVARLRERELQQHARLGRRELARRHEAHLIVVDLVVAQDQAAG